MAHFYQSIPHIKSVGGDARSEAFGRKEATPRIITHHLQTGDVLFPPQVLLNARPQCSQQVIRVHDYVHEGVDQTEESAVTT